MNDKSEILALLDKHTPGAVLAKIGLSPEQVRAAVRAQTPLSPEAVRRASARAVRKLAYGRGGLPAAVVGQMHADYQRLGSCAKVAALYGRTRQAMFDIFKSHGCALHAKTFKSKLSYGGRDYTFDSGRTRHRYWRATRGDREPLHRRIWREAGGAIPAGYELAFRDGDGANYALENLELVRKGTAARRRAREKRRAA